jgi:hypothetical protein
MWEMFGYHFQHWVHPLTNGMLVVIGVIGAAVTELLPGENYLIRAGAAAIALGALGILFVRLVRLMSKLKDNADEWAEIRRDVPHLKKEMAANTAATLATNRTLSDIKRTLDGMAGREISRDEREIERDSHQ